MYCIQNHLNIVGVIFCLMASHCGRGIQLFQLWQC